jgi:vacuolar protein sorting-associated protein 54
MDRMSSRNPQGLDESYESSSPKASLSELSSSRRESIQATASSPKGHLRAGSTANSITGIGKTLDNGQTSFAGPSQNAISTLLQSPIVRSGLFSASSNSASGFKAPTARDIPPVTLTNIPHVDSKAFQPYLAQIGSLYDAFRRAKEEGEGDSQLFRRDRRDNQEKDIEDILASRSLIPGRSPAGSINSVGSSEELQRRKQLSSRRRSPAVTPLSTIPSVYFDEDFHLENPRTFDIVSERSEVVRDPNREADTTGSGRKALATNAILQEKLSWYMDTVEIHLISSISMASKSFFSALGSLRELRAEAANSVERIQNLRNSLAKLDMEMAVGGMKVVSLKQRRHSVRQLGETVSQLQAVVESVTESEEMVENGEVGRALDKLDDVEKLVAGRQSGRGGEHIDNTSSLRDLRGIRALDGAIDDLAQLRLRIGKAYEVQFLQTLLDDVRHHVSSVPPDTTLRRWAAAFRRSRSRERQPSTFPAYMNMESDFRSGLQAELRGLARAQYTMPAAAAFKSSMLREIKNILRRNLPSSSDDDSESVTSASTHGGRQLSSQEKSSVLARNLRDLDAEDAQAMLTKIYTGVSESLRRLNVQVKILLDITSGLSKPPESGTRSLANSPNALTREAAFSPRSPIKQLPAITLQEDIQQVLDMSSLLGDAVDIVQGQITKVIKVRSEQTSHLPLGAFLRFFTLNRLFADECEAISGRSGASLKTTVDSQIKEFLSQFGKLQRHTVIEVMDADKWDAKDFGEPEVSVLTRILEGGTRDAPAWHQTSMIWLNQEERAVNGVNGAAPNGDPSLSTKAKVRSAVVDEQKFILPKSAATILRAVESFQHLMTGIPSMGQEIASSLLECLKLFNSRLSQLILGAGATRSAGLKNITTKHLAIASQALSFIVALIPYIREFFRRSMSSAGSNAMTEFDKVKILYRDHQNAIHEKLIEIMSSRASVHANAMKKIDWEEASRSTTPAISPYVETLAKETGTLQKVLSKHLPEGTVANIMRPVFASYKDHWSEAYKEVSLRSTAARERYNNLLLPNKPSLLTFAQNAGRR